jgi:predicted PurR-regulated permease PerM
MYKVKLDISWESLWRIFIFALVVTVFYLGRQIMLGLFLAIIIASGLERLADVMEKTGLPRNICVILIFLVILLLVILFVYSVFPIAIAQFNTIFAGAETGSGLTIFASLKSSKSFSAMLSGLSSQVFSGNGSPLDFFSSALGGVGLALSVIISSFYLSLSRDGVERFIQVVVPPDYEATVLHVYARSKKKLGAWFQMQLLLMVIMGLTVWGGMALLGVPYAFFIGAVAGIFELVPFLGPILAGAVAVISALGTSSTLAIYTLVFFVIAQQFESNLLVPMLSRRTIGIHPVIAIVALLIGAEVGGVLGIVISIPAAAVFQEVIEEWSTRKRAPAVAV